MVENFEDYEKKGWTAAVPVRFVNIDSRFNIPEEVRCGCSQYHMHAGYFWECDWDKKKVLV